jgi:hypothetical protein
MTFYSVRLELARSKEAPEGDAGHGYTFIAPLDPSGHLDAAVWKTSKAKCVVTRFTRSSDEQKGLLAHVGLGWHFDYDPQRREDDEPLFKLDRHAVKEGEYLSITEHDGVLRTFKVVSVKLVGS